MVRASTFQDLILKEAKFVSVTVRGAEPFTYENFEGQNGKIEVGVWFDNYVVKETRFEPADNDVGTVIESIFPRENVIRFLMTT